jgi:hypothetical protein
VTLDEHICAAEFDATMNYRSHQRNGREFDLLRGALLDDCVLRNRHVGCRSDAG